VSVEQLSVPDTIKTLYADHHGWLQGWLRRKLGNAFDAADLAQDTYVRVMVSGRVPPTDQSRSFLTQIAKGLVIDLHRRRQLEQAYQQALAQLPEQQVPSLETQAITLQTLISIDTALDSLPSKVRETFLLSQFDGLTYAEIAAQLGISVGAVRKYMLKAVQACFLALGV
jgi:RNA polymerase sigma factor (sigma-70 family)